MPVKLENVGIAVRDLEAAIAFFTDLGLSVLGRQTVSRDWTDTSFGLDGNSAEILLLCPVLVGGEPALPSGVRRDLELLDHGRFGNGVLPVRYAVRSAP